MVHLCLLLCWFSECICVPAISHYISVLVICCALPIFHIFNRFCLFSFARVVILVDKLKKFVGSKKRLFFLCHIRDGRVQSSAAVCMCCSCMCEAMLQLLTYMSFFRSKQQTINRQQPTSCNRPLIALETHSTMALKNAHMHIPKGGIWSLPSQPFFFIATAHSLLSLFDTVVIMHSSCMAWS